MHFKSSNDHQAQRFLTNELLQICETRVCLFCPRAAYFRKNNPDFHPYESARMCNGIICAVVDIFVCCGELLVGAWMRRGSKFDIALLKILIYLMKLKRT